MIYSRCFIESAALCPQNATKTPDSTNSFSISTSNVYKLPSPQDEQGASAFAFVSRSESSQVQPQVLQSREELSHNVQQIIEEINNKRKDDTSRLADFKSALEMHVGYSLIQLHVLKLQLL